MYLIYMQFNANKHTHNQKQSVEVSHAQHRQWCSWAELGGLMIVEVQPRSVHGPGGLVHTQPIRKIHTRRIRPGHQLLPSLDRALNNWARKLGSDTVHGPKNRVQIQQNLGWARVRQSLAWPVISLGLAGQSDLICVLDAMKPTSHVLFQTINKNLLCINFDQ